MDQGRGREEWIKSREGGSGSRERPGGVNQEQRRGEWIKLGRGSFGGVDQGQGRGGRGKGEKGYHSKKDTYYNTNTRLTTKKGNCRHSSSFLRPNRQNSCSRLTIYIYLVLANKHIT